MWNCGKFPAQAINFLKKGFIENAIFIFKSHQYKFIVVPKGFPEILVKLQLMILVWKKSLKLIIKAQIRNFIKAEKRK
jgi:hypothetical protein